MKRLMYIVFFLLMAANLLAQETYVIDSVCVGTERTYRRDGEKNYSYYWELIQQETSDTFNVNDTIIPLISGTDTTWGSEITQLWDTDGIFDVWVMVTTEHGCDTVEQGSVKVFPLPEAEAGPDRIYCNFEDIQVEKDSAWNHSSFFWATTGDGTFDNIYTQHPTYSVGLADSLAGQVTLVLTAYGMAENGSCEPAVDSVTFNFSMPQLELLATEISCFGDSTGRINAIVTGGQPPFNYQWQGPTGFESVNTAMVTDLWAGTYILTVTDANGCSDIDTMVLEDPPLIEPSIDLTQDISCYGYNDGMILSSAVGGTGNLYFGWTSSSGTVHIGNNIFNLRAATYYLEVRDDNKCVAIDSVKLTQPDSLLVLLNLSDTAVCLGGDISVSVQTIGGTGDIAGTWSGNALSYLSPIDENNALFEGAPDGTYYLNYTIEDESGCQASDSVVLHVYPPTYSYDSIEICAFSEPFPWNSQIVTSDGDRIYHDTLVGANQYGCDSILTLDVTVLFPEYYRDTIYVCENDEPYQPYGNITIATDRDSTYLDTAHYANGCDSLYVIIDVYSFPVTEVVLDTTLCASADTFKWNNRWIQREYSQVYLDTLENRFGCDSLLTYNVEITPPDTFYVFDTICQNDPGYVWNEISIQTQTDSIYEAHLNNTLGCDSLVYLAVHLLPATDAYLDTMICANDDAFYWNNRLIVSTRDSIYQDTLPNSNIYGCDSLLTYDVKVIIPDTVFVYDTVCQNEPGYVWNEITIQTLTDSIYEAQLTNSLNCDSIVYLDLMVIEGIIIHDTIEACEMYTWTAGTGETYTESGVYDQAIGSGLCSDTLRLHLTIGPPVELDTVVANILCYGDNTGSIDLIINGGTAPFDILWNTGETTRTVSNLPAGIYSATVSDLYGCSDSIEVEITQPDSLYIADIRIDTAESNVGVGNIFIEVVGGTPDYSFSWSTGDDTEDLENQLPGTYTLTVTDANGCQLERTFTIPVRTSQTILTVRATPTDVLCFDGSDGAVTLEISGGSGNYTYAWTGPDGYNSSDSIISGLIAGTYTVAVVDAVDSTLADTVSARVEQPEPLDVSFTKTDVGNSPDPVGSITLDISGGTGPYDVVWTFPDGSTSNDQNLTGLEIGNYVAQIRDANGCPETVLVAITGYGLTCPPAITLCPTEPLPVPYASLDEFIRAGGDTTSFGSPIVPASFTHVSDISNDGFCPEIITRTYSISNEAGETSTCEQLIIRGDDRAPFIKNIPDRIIYACGFSIPPQLNITTIKAYVNENCTLERISVNEYPNYRNGNCDYDIIREYQVFDQCGNPSNIERQVITVKDTTPPSVFPPGSSQPYLPELVSNDCTFPDPVDDIAVFRNQGVVILEDCNPPVSMRYIEALPALPAEPNVIFYVYRFADACGNYVDKQQRVILQGMDVPVFDPIGPLCQFDPEPVLPDTSLNGISGTWSPALISTITAGKFSFTFTPDDGQCAVPVAMEIEVTPAINISEDLTQHVDVGFSPDPIGNIAVTVSGGTGSIDLSWTGPGTYTSTDEDISNLYEGDYTIVLVDELGCTTTLTITITANKPEIACPPDTLFECPDPSVYPPFTTVEEFIAGGGIIVPDSAVTRFGSVEDTVASAYCLTIERKYFYEDSYGNTDTCTQRIDFYDNIAPVLVAPPGDTAECLSTTLPDIETLDDFIATTGTDVYDPNCELDTASFTVDKTTNVLPAGGSEVIYHFSIADLCGNVTRDSSYYLITDDQAPEVFCADITVYLDENGEYSLTVQDSIAMIDSLYDNCTAPEDMEVRIDWRDVTCEDVEAGLQVRIEVYDQAGLSDECIATITVADTLPPLALCRPDTIYLDENGQAGITVDMIDNGSYDNCTDVTRELDRYDFDCSDLGINPVTLTVTDEYGLTSVCQTTVTVIDSIAPQITCISLDTVQLSEEDGTYTLTYAMITASEWENCTIVDTLLSRYVLDCDDIENSPVTITATAIDQSGNVGTCTAEFVVFGNIPPEALPDYDTTVVNEPVTVNVVENDYDVGLKTDIRNETLELYTAPANGSVTIDKISGSVTYTPNPGFIGDDVFMYTICDDAVPCKEECAQALVFITVVPANEPPVALDDYFEVPCISLTGNVTFNDTDPDGDEIEVNSVPLVPPANGILVLYEDGHFEYEPFVDFVEGMDSFRYEIWDVPPFGESLYDTAWVYITRVPDNDCDGVADSEDIDDDNDGIRDNIENGGFWPEDPDAVMIDSDQDGIPDYLDIDSDNDGIVDNIEGQWEGVENYIEPLGWRDQNGNGWDAHYDFDEGALGVPFDIDLADTDGDGVPDYIDTDSDNDNVPDYIEGNDDNSDGMADMIRMFSDIDYDGLDDAYDWVDGWGIPDLIDNETGSLAPLQDFDGDGLRDWRDVNDEDDEYLTMNEDLNEDGDYSNDDLDLDGYPEYLDTDLECELFIPEGFSPNDDGVHDFFQILCIYPRYPDAKLMIFNRNGNLLWEKEKYGNYDYWGWKDAWWWGTSENKLTIGRSGGLPAGNYIYVLLLNDGMGGVRNGTVMVAY